MAGLEPARASACKQESIIAAIHHTEAVWIFTRSAVRDMLPSDVTSGTPAASGCSFCLCGSNCILLLCSSCALTRRKLRVVTGAVISGIILCGSDTHPYLQFVLTLSAASVSAHQPAHSPHDWQLLIPNRTEIPLGDLNPSRRRTGYRSLAIAMRVVSVFPERHVAAKLYQVSRLLQLRTPKKGCMRPPL